MPSRSSLACRCAASCAERCSSIARCLLAWAKARRLRISSAPASSSSSQAASPPAAQAGGTGWPMVSTGSHRKPR